ncbi:RNA polymerase sigma-70 factor [Brevibacillus ginsengisoli]|uniref:RNA polymerase sigma-70 factor n=1 Tax=Brevibacillus ginsengisoli TaxID=363854 RepID=UPI003CE7255C
MEKKRWKEFYLEYRALLFSLAYRMLGSVADAEDLVQDVFLQLNERELVHEQNIKSLLCTMVTHRSIDLLRSARKKREYYVGPWLPEPLVTTDADPLQEVIQEEYISLAMLVVMERLNPVERAVFILREVLDFDYGAIAHMIGKEESNCRKIFSRAKKKINLSPEDIHKQKESQEALVRTFIAALGSGNVSALMDVLAADVTYLADGGGIVTAAAHPIHAREPVSALLLALVKKFIETTSDSFIVTNVNGEAGIMIVLDGKVQGVIGIDEHRGKIQTIYMILNPEKLGHVVESERLSS